MGRNTNKGGEGSKKSRAEATHAGVMYFQRYHCLSGCSVGRDVTRLDGGRGKKQVWRSHVRTWGHSEAHALYRRKYLRYCCNFSAPSAVIRRAPQWFGGRGIVPPLPPLRYAPECRYVRKQQIADILVATCSPNSDLDRAQKSLGTADLAILAV